LADFTAVLVRSVDALVPAAAGAGSDEPVATHAH
jgi:hypothetical protein